MQNLIDVLAPLPNEAQVWAWFEGVLQNARPFECVGESNPARNHGSVNRYQVPLINRFAFNALRTWLNHWWRGPTRSYRAGRRGRVDKLPPLILNRALADAFPNSCAPAPNAAAPAPPPRPPPPPPGPPRPPRGGPQGRAAGPRAGPSFGLAPGGRPLELPVRVLSPSPPPGSEEGRSTETDRSDEENGLENALENGLAPRDLVRRLGEGPAESGTGAEGQEWQTGVSPVSVVSEQFSGQGQGSPEREQKYGTPPANFGEQRPPVGAENFGPRPPGASLDFPNEFPEQQPQGPPPALGWVASAAPRASWSGSPYAAAFRMALARENAELRAELQRERALRSAAELEARLASVPSPHYPPLEQRGNSHTHRSMLVRAPGRHSSSTPSTSFSSGSTGPSTRRAAEDAERLDRLARLRAVPPPSYPPLPPSFFAADDDSERSEEGTGLASLRAAEVQRRLDAIAPPAYPPLPRFGGRGLGGAWFPDHRAPICRSWPKPEHDFRLVRTNVIARQWRPFTQAQTRAKQQHAYQLPTTSRNSAVGRGAVVAPSPPLLQTRRLRRAAAAASAIPHRALDARRTAIFAPDS